MTQQAARKRHGRWLSRALLVVGGALAGTAAGWVFATASASATEVQLPSVPSIAGESVAQAENLPLGEPALETVDTVGQVVADPREATGVLPESLPEPSRFAEIDEDFDGFGAHMRDLLTPDHDWFRLPELPVLPTIPELTGELPVLPEVQPAPSGPHFEDPRDTDPIAAAADAAAGLAESIPGTVDNESTKDAQDDQRGDDDDPAAPVRLPGFPLPVPSGAGSTASSPGQLDTLLFGVASGPPAAFPAAVMGSPRAGLAHQLAALGRQPGVTPD